MLKANYFPVCGAGRLLEACLPHLDRARVEPVLLELATAGQPSSVHFVSPRTQTLEHHRLDWRGARRHRPVVAHLRRLVRELRIDAVNSHDMRCDLLCRLAGARPGLGVPWVAHVHGWVGREGSPRLRAFELADRWCVRAADEVWVGSRRAEQDVRRWLPARVPVRRFANAIAFDGVAAAAAAAPAARQALGLPAAAFVVGMHARLHRAKGHQLLAAAVLACRTENVHCLLLGYGDEEPALRALAASPAARGRLHVFGRQAAATTLALVAGLDLYCYASLRESMPLSVIEAMALGRAIVASDVGDLGVALGEGAGVLVPPGDVPAMARAIDALAANASLRRRLGERAAEVARQRFLAETLGAAMTTAWCALGAAVPA